MNSPAILVAIMMLLLATGSYSQQLPNPSCLASCGNLTIPYPFGIHSDCIADESFLITCNSSYSPPKPFLNLKSIEVLDISLDGQMRVASSVASVCYDDSGSQISKRTTTSELSLSKFQISSRQNKFTAVGCDMYALVEGSKHMKAGCISLCDGADIPVNGSCSGIGCCQSSIPEGFKDFLVEIRSFRNHTEVNSFDPCSYAFVGETDAFEFSSSDLKDLQNRKHVPVVLDWSVGYLSCQEAQGNLSSFACLSAHSECFDSSSGVGYLCKCMAGFEGNPYHVEGCQDINECIASEPCLGTCKNLDGRYSCSCPKGFEGDGKKDGEGCHSTNGSKLFYVAPGLVVPSIGISWIFWRRKQKKVDRLRRSLFLKNGGLLLQGRLVIFGAEELKKATDNYSENNNIISFYEIVQRGDMYRGILANGVLVTVIVPKQDTVEECNIEVFIANVINRSNIQHKSILRLIGCCLETQTPLLVFERFEPENSLHDFLYSLRARNLTWDIRLLIASETARALMYMHCDCSAQMITQSQSCLSSSSILLLPDGCHLIKLMPVIDVFSTTINYNILYLEPHCNLTNIFTEKSDVYRFGVVLAEILTGQKVYSRYRSEEERRLPRYFVAKTDNGCDELAAILDHRIELDGKIDELKEVAALARRCLSVSPSDRPTLTEVVTTLDLYLEPCLRFKTNC